jgi:G3E family GTPase
LLVNQVEFADVIVINKTGNAMDESSIRNILERCLLTDLEFVQGPDFWEQLIDTFTTISTQNDEEEVDA